MPLLLLGNLKRFGQLYIIFALILYVSYLRASNSACQVDNAYNEAAIALQNQNIAHVAQVQAAGHKKAQAAQKEAAVHQEKSGRELQPLLEAQVPTECEAAVHWGVEQGIKLQEN